MKIGFLDLNHKTRGIHTNTVPLGSGLISRYLKKHVSHEFDIKIFKDVDVVLEAIKSWAPDVLGLAQYAWNSELNMYIAKKIKRMNTDCLVVIGGPNLDIDPSRREEYLKKETVVDICVAYDGEIPFTEIIKRKLAGESNDQLKIDPVIGTYAISSETGNMVENLTTIPRLKTLDGFGTIYADGEFDSFLDQGYHPFLQTHRGCPFSCTFCHTGDSYYSKILFTSAEIFRKEMEYLGKRFRNQHNIILYVANANMGLFSQDFPIAEIIRETQEKYSWPKVISINSGKDPDKLLEMLSIISFEPAIALQTTTKEVLKNIKRINIPIEDYVSFQHQILNKTGETSATELILSLPGESKETFTETLRTVMNSGVQNIIVFTLMNLKGTPLSSDKIKSEYQHVIKHRVVPRQFSKIDGDIILDTEQVVVSTKTMSYQDYLDLRGLSFTVTIFFSSTEFIPIKKFMLEKKMDIAQWIFNLHEKIKTAEFIKPIYDAYIEETERELYTSKEALEDFFMIQDNYDALCEGKLGDNLLRKYKFLSLSQHYPVILDFAISELEKFEVDGLDETTFSAMLNSLKAYLSTREMTQWMGNKSQLVNLAFDIPSWLEDKKNDLLLQHYQYPCNYITELDDEQKRQFDDVVRINKEMELSLQVLYRDGIIRDFWPKWEKKD